MGDFKLKLKEAEQGLERVSKKQKVAYTKTISQIDSLISELTKCKDQLQPDQMETDSTSVASVLTGLTKKVKETQAAHKSNADHKELHAAISKLGKLIDKYFVSDLSPVRRDVKFNDPLLDEIIAQHLFRQGRFSVGEAFMKEAGVQMDTALREPFMEMYKILDAMLVHKNLAPAVEWARSRRKELEQKGTFIEFKLHKLNYIHLLSCNKRDEALAYARKHFPEFAATEMKEIQRLMTCMLYIGKLNDSPYASYLSPSLWTDMGYDFTSLLGLSYESPLYTAVTVGGLTLPKYLKIATLLNQQGKSFSTQPVEVDLGKEFMYHPIFACPVSREQTTPDNPPMLLTCGHVISKASMTKLARGGTRLKCPYCPSENSTTRAIQVTF